MTTDVESKSDYDSALSLRLMEILKLHDEFLEYRWVLAAFL